MELPGPAVGSRDLQFEAAGTRSEAVDVAFGEGAAYTALLGRLDARFATERPWSGLVTVDTLLHDGVPVVRVVPGSPAAQAGLQPGDGVLGADERPVKRTADLLAAVAAKKPGDKLIVPPPATVEAAEKRMSEGYECTDWYFCKTAL